MGTQAFIEKLISPFLSRGLSRQEVYRIHESVIAEVKGSESAARQSFSYISQLYKEFFTPTAIEAWQRLTGIAIRRDGIEYPEGYLPKQTLADLRVSLAQERKRLEADYRVEHHRNGSVKVQHTPSFAAARMTGRGGGDLDWLGSFDWAKAIKVTLPVKAMQVFLSGKPALVQGLVASIRDLETHDGDNDGFLVPRDLEHADSSIKAVLSKVYQEVGKKRLSVEQIADLIPSAVAALFHSGQNRRNPAYGGLYLQLAIEMLSWIRQCYVEQVIRNPGVLPSAFFAGLGFQQNVIGQLRQLVPGITPKPTSREVDRLWKAAQAGKLTRRAFYAVSQLSPREVAELERKEPHHATRSPSTELPVRVRTRIDSEQVRQQKAKELGTAATRLHAADVLMKWEDILERLNADAKLVGRWGVISRGHLKFIAAQYPQFFPDMRSRENRLAAIEADVKELLKHKPSLTHSEVYSALSPKYPNLKSHHLDVVGGRNPGLFRRRGGNTRSGFDSNQQTAAVAARVRTYLAEDPLVSLRDIVERLNSERAFASTLGRMTPQRYNRLQQAEPGLFPKLNSTETWVPTLAREVRALRKEGRVHTRRELLRALQEKHPRISASRLSELERHHPGLLPNSRPELGIKRPTKKIAREISVLLSKNPSLSYDDIATTLQDKYPGLSIGIVANIVKKYRKQLFTNLDALPRFGAKIPQRDSLPVRKLLELVLRLLPPGTPYLEVGQALNRCLEARGLPPYRDPVATVARLGGATIDRQAPAAAQIVAEYAAAAPSGASESEILSALIKDYPSLNVTNLGVFKKVWLANPAGFPVLSQFFRRRGENTGLVLHGLGKPQASPRFLNGWSVERSVLGGSTDEEHQLNELSQYARIPLRLPLLDQVRELLSQGAAAPLRNKNLLIVSHLLASSVPLMYALQDAGALLTKTAVVGTPYGSNPAVCATLREQGYDLRVPELSLERYRAAVEKALDDTVARHRLNGETILVMDDGGTVADLLHTKEKYADVLAAIKIVEQTTGGLIVDEKHALKVPIVAAAKALSKVKEGSFIGAAVAAKVCQGLEGLGRSVVGEKVVVVGYGTVGSAVANQLRSAGAKVVVIEPSPQRQAAAVDNGFAVARARERAFSGAGVVIGCSGTTSVRLDDLTGLKPGAVIASASSKRIEFDMDAIEAAATRRIAVQTDAPWVRLPTREYIIAGKSITVLGDGWPVNFDGDVEDIAPEQIQITRALMFAGLLQASGTVGKPGFVRFDPIVDRQILDAFKLARQQSTGIPPLRSAKEWRSVIVQLAREMRPVDDHPPQGGSGPR